MQFSKQLKNIAWITFAWMIVSLLNFFIGMAAVIDANYIWDANYDIGKIDFWQGVYISIVSALMAGIIGGSAIVFLWEKWLRSKPYGWTLRNMFFSYIIIFNMVTIPTVLINNTYHKEVSIWSSYAWNEVRVAYESPSLLVPFFFWLLIVMITLIVFQVNDKYGPGVFRKFLLGKYFNPTKEERIFMFLDLRSSTTIAEKLGEEQYFHFLKDVFQKVTPAIIKLNGEVYQYVGDEIVLSWSIDKGLRNNQCIECFFEVQRLLRKHKEYFEENFGIVPEFKAGLHYGNVMAGEIGVIKREIAYSGDVLNTTARIQSKCNELGVDILLSEILAKRLTLKGLQSENLGSIELRGKAEEVNLITINKD